MLRLASYSWSQIWKADLKPLFFCHIPKTAGTALRKALEESLQPHEIMPSQQAIFENNGHYPDVQQFVRSINGNAQRWRLFRGHYHFSVIEALPNAIPIVLLRDPLKRTISHIQHLVQHFGLSLTDVKESLRAGRLPLGVPDNLMTRFLGGALDLAATDLCRQQDWLFHGPIADADARLSSAEENLKRVSLLGYSDNLSDLARKLSSAGVSIGRFTTQDASRSKIEFSQQELEAIREHNRLDYELYRRARADAVG